jgi:D-alanyl-D-alanine carboxypeptidase
LAQLLGQWLKSGSKQLYKRGLFPVHRLNQPIKTPPGDLTQFTIPSNSDRLSVGVERLDNAGTPEKPPETTPNSPPPLDDIPVAQREGQEVAPKPQTNVFLLLGSLAALGIAALAAGSFMALRIQSPPTDTLAMESPTPTTQPSPAGSPSAGSNAETLLGHFAYTAAPQAELAPIVADGSIKLRKAAAKAYREMVAAAQQEGISIVPISGFRSLEDQKYLYFDVKADRNQNAAERAKVSAPPGYSEHHTGYAVDIGDGNTPALNLSPDFDKTAAYRWLKDNANRYSFELSFTKNNRQGVSYEPWHWRYVGDIQSLKTFYKARGQK